MSTDDPLELDPGASAVDAPDVLVVCTANVARSPLLEVRLQAEADQRLGPGAVVVGSAGTYARFGQAAAEGSRQVAGRWGLSLVGHASKPAMYVPLGAVPLILAMTEEHFRALSARDGGVAAKAFTAPELAACVERLAADDRLPVLPPPDADRDALRAHLTELAEGADGCRPIGRGRKRRQAYDVPDPIGASQEVYDALGERFVAIADVLGAALFGPRPG